MTFLNIVDIQHKGLHIASRIPNQTSLTHRWETFAHGWLRWVGTSKCLTVDPHRARTDKQGILDQAEGQGVFVDPVLAEARQHMVQTDTCRDSGFLDHPFVFLRTILMCHSWNLRVGSGNRLQKRHKMTGLQRLRWKRTRRSERT